MKNLEQIRASHALKFSQNAQATGGENGGDVVRGLSALIMNNGLLATLSLAKEKGKGYETFMVEIGRYLSSPERKILESPVHSLDGFINELTKGKSFLLQQATAEALAYLGYLKRFRNKGKEEHVH